MLRNRLLTHFLFHPLIKLVHPLLILISSFWLSWLVLAQCDFLYSGNYQLLEIDQHISEFAPQNRHRDFFEHVDKANHERLFSEICDAIRHQPSDLNNIQYHYKGAGFPLLHHDEVVHLTDVSNLIMPWEQLGLIVTALTLLIIIVGIINHQPLPEFLSISFMVVGILTICIMIYMIDPQGVFVWLHETVFPDDHPWFFYYQDSLMTTLMKAPDLFFVIAIEWVALAIIMLIIYLLLVTKWHNS